MSSKRTESNSPEPALPAAPPAPRTKVTASDVAKALGVSPATISNAFNRPDQLSVTLRTEIISRSRELGYFGPDPAARALRRRDEVREVAVLYHHGLEFALSDPISLDFLRGVSHELDRRALSLQLIPKLGRDLQLAAAFQTTADALIVHAEIGPNLVPEVVAARKPLVLVDTVVEGVPSIGIEDRDGADQAMAYALSKQPDRVLAVCFTLNGQQRRHAMAAGRKVQPRSASVAIERRIGFVRAARRLGRALDTIDWIEVDDIHPETSEQALAALRVDLPAGSRLAVVGMTDRMALAALTEVRTWPGVTLAVAVGFDDIPAAAAVGLTTLRQDAHRKGVLAVQALLDGLRPAPLGVELVVRDT
ncbi:LacI family DNA-binding transcriptional regulator [Sphaerotilus sulfidivorans]|nr:transcriptional regulator [Sphaerotilus natans]